jgi:hypothetical protein
MRVSDWLPGNWILTGAARGFPDAQREPERSWLLLSEGLLGGLRHTLNNRLGTISAVAQVLEADLPPGHALSGALSREVQRLEGTVALLGAIGEGGGEPEPVQLEAILVQVGALFDLHHSLRDTPLRIDVQPGVLPLRVRPPALLRALLILLASAGRQAPPGGTVAIHAVGDESLVTIRVACEEVGGDEQDDPLSGLNPDGAGVLLEAEGGELRVEAGSGPTRYVVTLPTLLEVRRREQVR